MIETFSAPIPADICAQAEDLMRRLCERRLMVSLAESCTGGLLAAMLTDVEGCAHAFDRGFVTYTDGAKCEVLGVPAALIEQSTAVSRRVAHAMVVGVLAGTTYLIGRPIIAHADPAARARQIIAEMESALDRSPR